MRPEETANKIKLEIDTEKTKVMELTENWEDPRELQTLMYEQFSDFRFLEANLSFKND